MWRQVGTLPITSGKLATGRDILGEIRRKSDLVYSNAGRRPRAGLAATAYSLVHKPIDSGYTAAVEWCSWRPSWAEGKATVGIFHFDVSGEPVRNRAAKGGMSCGLD
jgi:hypothetical protein